MTQRRIRRCPGFRTRVLHLGAFAFYRSAMEKLRRPKRLLSRLCRVGAFCALLVGGGGAVADSLETPAGEPPSGRLQRGSVVRFVYRADLPAVAKAQPGPAVGTLTLDWTDALGRQVEHRVIAVRLTGAGTVSFPVDLGRVVATSNTMRGRLLLGGRETEASAAFVVPPRDDGWADWQTIMWPSMPAQQLMGLQALGVGANARMATREQELTPADVAKAMAPLLAANLAPYIENIATDFYAPYHRWRPGKSVVWLMDEARRKYKENAADPTVRIREPSLSDPVWQAKIDARLTQHVRLYGPYGPLFYDLGDETGIADLAANWDFDFSPQSLAGMRGWLRTQYPSLAALNRQWGTAFPSWDDVTPPTTEATVARKDGNYSAWSDFKEWMDEAFYRALRQGTRAVHAADPLARSGIEGVQAPGWGGYDFSRIAHATDVAEIYDMHNSVEIAMALNPSLISLSTAARTGPGEKHRVWHQVLQGERGMAIWDEKNGTVTPEGAPGPRGEEMRGLWRELRGGVVAQLIASRIVRDPVAILYSPASYRVHWLLDVKADTQPWTARDSERESFDSTLRAAMRRSASLLQHDGLQPNWLTPELLADGALEARGIRLLVLPHVLALSDAEAGAIGRFVRRGGVVLADVVPGEFDGHGRRRAQPALAPLGGKIRLTEALQRDDAPVGPFMQAVRDAGIEPMFRVEAPDGTVLRDVDIRQFRNGRVMVVGLLRDMPASGAPGPAQPAVLRLNRPAWRTDLRGQPAVGQAARFPVQLDPTEPAMLALSPVRLPRPVLSGPRQARLGDLVGFDLRLSGPSSAAVHVVQLEVRDPTGQVVGAYGANVALRGGRARWQLKPALNDKPGIWTVTARDALGAGVIVWPIAIAPARQ